MVSIKTGIPEHRYLLVYLDKILDNQHTLAEYDIKNIDYIEFYPREDRYITFFKNSGYVFGLGVIFGIGHMIAALVLKHGFDDVLSSVTN